MRINVSEGKLNLSQRNNERDPFNTCNVTSMIMALDYLGYDFPEGKYKNPVDNFHFFMTEQNLRPTWHFELSRATNLWMDKKVTDFATGRSINAIFNELKNDRPVVLSGDFPGYPTVRTTPLGHIVVLVGAEWDSAESENPKSIIIDDPYGDTLDDWRGCGNDIVLSWDQFIAWFKDRDSTTTKWGHFFRKPAEL